MQQVVEQLNSEIDLAFDEPVDEPIETKPSFEKKPSSRKRLLMVAATALLIAGTIFGTRYYRYAMSRESTDDAFIEGHVIQISPKVAGHVSKVYVNDNQEVKKGDLLVEIDARDFEARLEQARAALDAAIAKQKAAEVNVTLTQRTSGAVVEQASSSVQLAKSGVQTARAQAAAARSRLDQSRAQVTTTQTNVEQTYAEIKAAEAEARRAQADAERYQQLYASDEVSQQQLDRAVTTAKAADAELEATRKKAAGTEARVAEARAAEQAAAESLRQSESQTAEAEARVGEALGRLNQAGSAPQQVAVSKFQVETAGAEIGRLQADVKQAELNLSYTKIYAPESGRVTRKAVEEGAFVQVGQPLVAVVPSEVWVIANFKETQLAGMRPGQPVEIQVDAYPDKVFKGHVESLQSGTGARFSLLPPENATGNYIKVVQRVPVKILFDESPDTNHLLAPGMSVMPEVKVK